MRVYFIFPTFLKVTLKDVTLDAPDRPYGMLTHSRLLIRSAPARTFIISLLCLTNTYQVSGSELTDAIGEARALTGFDALQFMNGRLSVKPNFGFRRDVYHNVIEPLFVKDPALSDRPAHAQRVAKATAWIQRKRAHFRPLLLKLEHLDQEFMKWKKAYTAPPGRPSPPFVLPARLHPIQPGHQNMDGRDLICFCLLRAANVGGNVTTRIQRTIWADEAHGAFRRLRGLMIWADHTLFWLEGELARGLKFLQSYPDQKIVIKTEFSKDGLEMLAGNLFNLPGHFTLLHRLFDTQAVDLALPEIFLPVARHTAGLGGPLHGPFASYLRNLPQAARSTGRVLLQAWVHCKTSNQMFAACLDNPTDLAQMSHSLTAYSGAKNTSAISDLGKTWVAAHPALPNTRPGTDLFESLRMELMEVLSVHQGTMQCGLNPDHRFHEALIDKEARDILTRRNRGGIEEAMEKAADGTRKASAFFSNYSPEKLFEIFGQRNNDCFRAADLLGCRIANIGLGGTYPLLNFFMYDSGESGTHLEVVFRSPGNKNRFLTILPSRATPDTATFPSRRFCHDRQKDGRVLFTIRFVRTLSAWVSSELVWPDGTVEEIALPHRNQKGRTYNLPPFGLQKP